MAPTLAPNGAILASKATAFMGSSASQPKKKLGMKRSRMSLGLGDAGAGEVVEIVGGVLRGEVARCVQRVLISASLPAVLASP